MKKLTIIATVLVLSITATFGQTAPDSISMKKVFGGYAFFQNEKRLNMNQLLIATETNEQAYKIMKEAKTTYTWATIVGSAGGFMVGWQLGTALAGGEPNWVMAGVGAGLVIVSIPISNKFNTQAKSAVETFNGGLRQTSFWNKNELKFALTENGVGLTLKLL